MSKQKRKKRRFLHRDMTVYEKRIGFILFILLCIFAYFVVPFSRISTISVIGNKDTDAQSIEASANVVPNDLILSLWLRQNSIKENIKKQQARVADVAIRLEAGNVFQIQVTEYDTIAYVEQNEDYYTILSSGIVLKEESKKYLGTVPIVKWEGTIQTLEIMAKELAKLTSDIRDSISDINYKESDKLALTIFMNDGNQIKANYTNFASKLEYYKGMKSVLEGKKGIIDLTVGAYFVPYKE
ncbi:FtsQ-type POTRA domain-containing protein [Granulicatella sp. zg-ZJ]|uniref:cell division protein FtsQ/DivIB n=1 Tax=Granulicatella sp. zg-ZJ TaxID=2678504 RepID=UPI0013D578AB|nr:cell division protein FtsQ/DivIB [Granulicatella sp. zg-ZJ]NEW62941.1 FtsQ-type POTRA domain-containing protein [Granulicatella sp. zg-ZJ]